MLSRQPHDAPALEPHWFRILLSLADRDLHGLGIMNDVLERTGGRMLVLLGLALGIPSAPLGTRLMSSLLFGTSPHDVVTFAGATTLLLVVSLVACYIPARRATRVDPMVALRWE